MVGTQLKALQAYRSFRAVLGEESGIDVEARFLAEYGSE
jgi:hypothetical protein